MKALKINLTAYVKLSGGWRFCAVPVGKNGRLKPGFVLVAGKEEAYPDPKPYYLDFLQDGRRRRLAAGKTAAEAQAAVDAKTRELTAHKAAAAAGIALPKPETIEGTGRSLQAAVDVYLAEIQAHKKKKTHSAYRTALFYFLESCRKETLEEINRADMLHFITYLRKKSQSARSVRNKFENVMTFLKQNKVTGLIHKTDWPKFTEAEVDICTDEELETFFAACNETENLWFRFFLETAMREQEVMHVSWSDINFERKVITVRENKRFGWVPKANKEREIAVPSDLVELLKTWKSKSDKTCGLVFPTAGCKPKLNFLDECKAIAKRAGLTDSDFYLHKFRATRATYLLQNGVAITNVVRLMGHSDLKSTMRYQGVQHTDMVQAQIEQISGGAA